jgi:secreted PhoX family phosphatase
VTMNRRAFLRSSAIGATVVALGPSLWMDALAAPAVVGAGPYGPLGEPDANGIRLPAGFTSRVVAVSGQPVGRTGYIWHPAPDGGACFPTGDGGWVYVSNSEVPLLGGAGALKLSASGEIVDAYRILVGTSMNCAGGPTPWGTWLSCEEHALGMVWECNPLALGTGLPRPALGRFSHEAVAIDPGRGHAYLTEDQSDSLFRRFTPVSPGDLSAGTLEAAQVASDGSVTWVPDGAAGATTFDGGEGIFWHDDVVWFTTKGDNRVWTYHCATETLEIAYDDTMVDAPLRGVDNVTISALGDVLVAEDGDDMNICILALEEDGTRTVAPILQVVGHVSSEIAGPAFSPDGTRLYFSSQRGPAPAGPGITYEVTGPFRG